MPTNTAAVVPAARQDPRQVVNTLRKTVNFGDAGISSGLAFDNGVPLGAFILRVLVEVVAAFNAVTTNVLTVGFNSTTFNDLVAAGDVDEATVGVYDVVRGLGRGLCAAADKVPYAKYTQSGTAATTGQAVITLTFDGGWES